VKEIFAERKKKQDNNNFIERNVDLAATNRAFLFSN
jgi:hypothetical protein